MAERKITVFIYLPGETTAVPAGIFSHDADSGVGSFSYGRKYIERGNALPVDPVALPIGPPLREVTVNGGILILPQKSGYRVKPLFSSATNPSHIEPGTYTHS